jgi:hypothetical protein
MTINAEQRRALSHGLRQLSKEVRPLRGPEISLRLSMMPQSLIV